MKWQEALSAGGFFLTAIGVIATFYQARKAKTASEAARTAVEMAVGVLAKNQLLILLPQLSQLERQLNEAVAESDISGARRGLEQWRQTSSRVRGVLAELGELESSLERKLTGAATLSAVAVDRLLTASNTHEATQKARKAIADVGDLLGEITGRITSRVPIARGSHD